MKRKLTIFIALFFMGIGLVTAQTQVRGTVVDEKGEAAIGATIQIKGTSQGTTTDADGKFTLSAPANATLVVSYVGYKTQEVKASANVRVVLQSDTELLDELVVTAYGVQKKSSLTGAVASVDANKLERIPTTDASKALEGVVAGVSISSVSGTPGQGTRIRIRGIGSLNASSAPLIIVDGAPFDGDINTINPADIESYNVLKDAASAALYGARGANGVVLIQTKQGKKGQTSVTFDAKAGYNYRGVPEYDLITDPAQFYEMAWSSLYNVVRFDPNYAKGTDGKGRFATAAESARYASDNLYDALGGYLIYKGIGAKEIVGTDGKINPKAKDYFFADPNWNDWHGALFKPQMREEYNLSVSKGSDHSTTFFSLGYLTDKGYNLNSYFNRITARLNHSTDIYKWLKFSNNIQFSRTDKNMQQTGGTMANTFYFTRAMPPIHPIYKYDKDGKVMLDVDGNKIYEDGTEISGVSKTRTELKNLNVVATQNDDMDKDLSYIINNTANLTFLLPYNISLALNATYTGEFYYNTYRQAAFGDAKMYNGRISKTDRRQDGLNSNQILDWNKKLLNGDMNLAIKLGHESYSMKHTYLEGQKSNMLDLWDDEMSTAAKIEYLTSYAYSYNLDGYFGQITSDYLNKYYLSLSARRDGSSVFHPDHRWGNFWSAGFSWRLSEEAFFAPVKDVVDNLKFRLSYGAQGNDFLYRPNGVYRAWRPYENNYIIRTDGADFSISPLEMGNKEITWEKNHNLNAALEFSLFKNVLSGEVEFFQRKTSDMLFNIPVPASTGFQTKPVNVGEMKNTGFEATLRANIINNRNIRWSVDANLTHYKNEITKLPDEFKEKGIRPTDRTNQLLFEGKSIYEFNTVKWAGVDPKTGDALYWMRGKSADGKLEDFKAQSWNTDLLETSYQWIGSALPDLQGGFGTQFEVYGVDLSMQFSYGLGGQVNDATYSYTMTPDALGRGWHKDIFQSWSETKGITETNVPRLRKDDRNLNQPSSRFFTDASFLAFRNVMLGYTFPSKLTSKASINSFRIYAVVDNVHLWSKRQGLDPRMFISGAGNYVYSPMRTISLGLSLKF